MTQYLSSLPFRSKPNTREFEKNYYATFGRPVPKCTKRGCPFVGTEKECDECKDAIDVSNTFERER